MGVALDTNVPVHVPPPISIWSLIRRFKGRVYLTWLLVLLEGSAYLFIPLVIGMAIDDLLSQSYTGITSLAGLCCCMLVIGAARRFYDTRAYAKIFRTVSTEMVAKEKERNAPISTISARSRLFQEFIDFLEHSIPEISHNFINLLGSLVITAILDLRIFVVCLTCGLFAVCIYWFSSNRIYQLNKEENDELERQVTCLDKGSPEQLHDHFRKLMRWKIKLSDLETANFTGVWLGLSAVLVATVIILSQSNGSAVGSAVSMIMYVFGFIESTVAFPLYYQQLVRLHEIAGRLE